MEILLILLAFFLLAALLRLPGKPSPPYCSLNPVDHPAFVWRDDGSGWIDGACVIKAR